MEPHRSARGRAPRPASRARLRPSVYACYRFTAKLRQYDALLCDCIARVVGSLAEANAGMGDELAIDGSDMPAYANGQRFVSKGGRERGASIETCALDKGYEATAVYEACEARGARPIIPLRQTTGVRRGDHKPLRCEHGEWRFAGSGSKRQASKWRCPTGECKPASDLGESRPPTPAPAARDAALVEAGLARVRAVTLAA